MSRESFEHVCRLMNLPSGMIERIEAIQKTGDGFYLARDKGDIGFNRFIGKPSAPHAGPGRKQMLKVWRSLSDNQKRQAIVTAASMRINLRTEFGVPTSDVPMFELTAR